MMQILFTLIITILSLSVYSQKEVNTRKTTLECIVVNDKTGEKEPNTIVKLINTIGEIVKTDTTNKTGSVVFRDISEGKYKAVAEKDNYSMIADFEFNTDSLKGKKIIAGEIFIKKNVCGLIGLVTDEKDNPLEGVKVLIKNDDTGGSIEYVTNSKGIFKDGLKGIPCPGGMIDYEFTFEKDGYDSKTIEFKYSIKKSGVVMLNDFMKKITLQSRYTGCIHPDISTPFFKKNSTKLDDKAKHELDKIVFLMKENSSMNFEFGGHASCNETNKRTLGYTRAATVKKYLVSKGIAKNRVFFSSFGSKKSINGCKCGVKNNIPCTEKQHAENRRVEFRLIE